MTKETIIWQSSKSAVHMAGRTFHRRMCADQLKVRFCMFEHRRTPAVERMARQTLMRKKSNLMVWRHRLGKIFLMTGKTFG
jgi:hypothetical protein